MNETGTYNTITNTMDLENDTMHPTSMWVFGYGSLVWKPDFHYAQKETGYIKGFKRRFWQGNATHRGTEEKLARVATLIKSSKKNRVWGVAFEIKGKEAMTKALGGLTKREITLGGYEIIKTAFHPRDKSSSSKTVTLFVAMKDNELFLGKAPVDIMAREIVVANGNAGSNIEYVTRLADYMRNNVPEDSDRHLFELDRKVRELSLSFTESDSTYCIIDIDKQNKPNIQQSEHDKNEYVRNNKAHETKDQFENVDNYKSTTFSYKISEIALSIFKLAFNHNDIDHKHRMIH